MGDFSMLHGASVLITGGAGFIGSHLTEALLRSGCKVTVLDNFVTGRNENLQSFRDNPDFKLLRHDIEVFRKIRDRKTVVLNLDSRWEEYLAEKKMEDEQNKLIRLKSDEPEKEKNNVKDLYLDETLNVMRDWIDMAPRTAEKAKK